jgi:hypothetical protein
MVRGKPHSAQTLASRPLTRVRVVKCQCLDRASLRASPGARRVTVQPLQLRMSDSPHRSGDCPTTTWCGASSRTVLKRTHCGQTQASMVKYPRSDRASLCATVRTGPGPVAHDLGGRSLFCYLLYILCDCDVRRTRWGCRSDHTVLTCSTEVLPPQ